MRLAQVVSQPAHQRRQVHRARRRASRLRGRARRRARCVLRVRDNGIGIAPEMLPRVFELFVQERAGARPRAGRPRPGPRHRAQPRRAARRPRRARAATGAARAASSSSGCPPRAAARPRAPAAPRAARAPRSRGARRRVLIVDDNVDAAASLGRSARPSRPRGADGARRRRGAADRAPSFQPDVALLDIGLPVMDGYELARRLRDAAGPARALRLIAVTGYGQEADRRQLRGRRLRPPPGQAGRSRRSWCG